MEEVEMLMFQWFEQEATTVVYSTSVKTCTDLRNLSLHIESSLIVGEFLR